MSQEITRENNHLYCPNHEDQDELKRTSHNGENPESNVLCAENTLDPGVISIYGQGTHSVEGHDVLEEESQYVVDNEPVRMGSCTRQLDTTVDHHHTAENNDIHLVGVGDVYFVSDENSAEESAMYTASAEHGGEDNAIEDIEKEPKVEHSGSTVTMDSDININSNRSQPANTEGGANGKTWHVDISEDIDIEPYAVTEMCENVTYTAGTTSCESTAQNPHENQSTYLMNERNDDSGLQKLCDSPNINRLYPNPMYGAGVQQQASEDSRQNSDVHKLRKPDVKIARGHMCALAALLLGFFVGAIIIGVAIGVYRSTEENQTASHMPGVNNRGTFSVTELTSTTVTMVHIGSSLGTNTITLGTINGTKSPSLGDNHGTNTPTLGTINGTKSHSLGNNHGTNITTLGSINGTKSPSLGNNHGTNITTLGSINGTKSPSLGNNHGTNITTLGSINGTKSPSLGNNHSTNPPNLCDTHGTKPPTNKRTHADPLHPGMLFPGWGGPTIHKKTACEEETLQLSCADGKKFLFIDDAFYGRRIINGRCRCGFFDTNCHRKCEKTYDRKSCQGLQRCGVTATNKNFGDPCPGTSKYLEVKYHCEGSESREYISLGCWRDTSDRAIPTLEGTDPRLDGDYKSRENPIEKCYQVALSRGFTVFAVQAGGWCGGSADGLNTYNKYGPSTTCASDGEGGPYGNEVYKITGQTLINAWCTGILDDDHLSYVL
uniref:SUEL-type lectin domain-containing protein n=1 Tax=Branchiostoma floridae TaxID=7739 RepID=C3ZZI5_BRAFL|eukprot:XP_002586041.1 hypothetical protein BRAFLDRAFT_110129 [Branchiostoma floridae]